MSEKYVWSYIAGLLSNKASSGSGLSGKKSISERLLTYMCLQKNNLHFKIDWLKT